MLLDRYPVVGRIYLVVRPKGRRLARGAPVEPSRHAAMRSARCGAPTATRSRRSSARRSSRSTATWRPLCGFDEALVRELAGTIDAVVNVAGVVDFNPPLDEALNANAHGAQNLVALTQALGEDARVAHEHVLRRGDAPRPHSRGGSAHPSVPAGRGARLRAWDPDREIAECLDLVAQADHRATTRSGRASSPSVR